ncbi:MAG: Na+/H+ antiporter NhaC family protein, partial [Patiriisocius sp.]
MPQENLSDIKFQEQKIKDNTQLNIWEALIPVVILMSLLAYNIFLKDGAWLGDYSNQYILLIGGVVAMVVGLFNKVSIGVMIKEVIENLKSVYKPIIILMLVGALAGTWLVSGIIPAMVYYGLQVLSPEIFLPASVIIAAIISIATGSSWTTSATVGIALVGIGTALGINPGMIAGAVISGAYFGDKMSPLSDTTNLAPAMAGTDLFTHIKYMAFTTVPTIIITLIVFSILSMTIETSGEADISNLLQTINATFNTTGWLFLVPLIVIGLIVLKINPLISLATGVVSAAIFAVIFQPEILATVSDSTMGALSQAIFSDTAIETPDKTLNKLFSSGGLIGMLWTILLIASAMVFGGVMDGIGALARITKALLKMASSVFGLFATTVVSCFGLNVIASDQYLALVIPGKMFKKAYQDKDLAPENLSRTLEDSG